MIVVEGTIKVADLEKARPHMETMITKAALKRVASLMPMRLMCLTATLCMSASVGKAALRLGRTSTPHISLNGVNAGMRQASRTNRYASTRQNQRTSDLSELR